MLKNISGTMGNMMNRMTKPNKKWTEVDEEEISYIRHLNAVAPNVPQEELIDIANAIIKLEKAYVKLNVDKKMREIRGVTRKQTFPDSMPYVKKYSENYNNLCSAIANSDIKNTSQIIENMTSKKNNFSDELISCVINKRCEKCKIKKHHDQKIMNPQPHLNLNPNNHVEMGVIAETDKYAKHSINGKKEKFEEFDRHIEMGEMSSNDIDNINMRHANMHHVNMHHEKPDDICSSNMCKRYSHKSTQ